MEMFNFDVASLFSFSTLSAIILGTLVGILIGALPGLGAVLALVLMLPLTYSMEPMAAILLLLATYQGAEYGGSISAVILGIPGTPAALVTVFDGNAMAKKGEPGKAIAYSLTASVFGGLAGGLALIFLSGPLVKFALSIGEPEFFLIGLLGLFAVGMLSSADIVKSMIAAVLGLMVGTIGMDAFTGVTRFTFGRIELMEGIDLVALLVGMFAISELFIMVSKDLKVKYKTDQKGLTSFVTRLEMKNVKKIIKPITVGSLVGIVVGILPGMGAGPASWFSYTIAKKTSKSPETFGKGNPEGIAAPEAANNATVGGALLPLLTLGIPGSPSIAIIMGAFIIHGIQPGPKLFAAESDLVYGILYGFLLTTVALYILGKFITAGFVKMLTIPNPVLIPVILGISFIGAFSARSSYFDVWLALIVGIISLALIKLDFSLASFVLALILCPIIEESFRRSLILSQGSYSIFFTRPISLALIAIMLIILGFGIKGALKRKKVNV
jgi:putative tricarboxylic transport membrane protein